MSEIAFLTSTFQGLIFSQYTLSNTVFWFMFDWSSWFLFSSDHIWNIWYVSENRWGADRSIREPAPLSPSSTPCVETLQPYTQAAAPNWQVYHPLANYCWDAGALTSSHHTAKVSQVDLHTFSVVKSPQLFYSIWVIHYSSVIAVFYFLWKM